MNNIPMDIPCKCGAVKCRKFLMKVKKPQTNLDNSKFFRNIHEFLQFSSEIKYGKVLNGDEKNIYKK